MFHKELNKKHSGLLDMGGCQPFGEELRAIASVIGRPYSGGSFHPKCSCLMCVTGRLVINMTRRKLLLEDLTKEEANLVRFSGLGYYPVEAQSNPLTHEDVEGGDDKIPKSQFWFINPRRKMKPSRRDFELTLQQAAQMIENPRRAMGRTRPMPEMEVKQVITHSYTWAASMPSYSMEWNATKSMKTLMDEYKTYLNSCANCGKGVDPTRRDIVTETGTTHYWRFCNRCMTKEIDKLFVCKFCDNPAVAESAASFARAMERDYQHCCNYCSKDATYCEGCDTYYATSNCERCNRPQGLHRHNYTPRFSPLLTKDETLDYTKLMTGVELEMGTKRRVDLHEVARFINTTKGMYAVHDGSITRENDNIVAGIEIVTMPFSQAYWAEHLKARLESVISELKTDYQMEAASQFSCGFHIHLSRAAFTPARLYKLIYLMTKNASWTYKIGQRDEDNWTERYCSFNKEAKTTKDLVDKACGYPGDPPPPLVDNRFGGGDGDPHKYVAINTTGNKSIELRMFKGTLNIRAIQKNLEFAWAVYDWAGVASNSELNIPHFLDFVRRRRKMYPHLFEYLRALRQYPGIKGDSFLPLYQGD